MSIADVPAETIYLQLHGTTGHQWSDRLNLFTITDQYFAMPLYQVLNEEMINFDNLELPRDDLEFLCDRYSAQKADISADLSKQEKQELLYRHLIELREDNVRQRQQLTKVFQDAIL